MRTKTLIAALACALVAATAGTARAADYGVTEDFGKAAPEWILQTMQDYGMTRNVISLTFDPTAPMVLDQADEIDKLVALAPDYGVRVAIAVYQRQASALATPIGLAAFSSWLRTAALRWPTVTTWIANGEHLIGQLLDNPRSIGADDGQDERRLHALSFHTLPRVPVQVFIRPGTR